MNSILKSIRSLFAAFGLVALLAAAFLAGSTKPALAHETPCPYCGLTVVQDTMELDNEVVLRYGNKRIEYRCVLCAIAEAKSKYKNDITILAPSSVKGKPVTITRKAGEWSATPATALFVYAKGSHKQCEVRYRAVADQGGFVAFVKANPKVLQGAKALTLQEIVELSK